ncbi:MAG: GxxExxY protein [Ardenticatenaceae bacterium]
MSEVNEAGAYYDPRSYKHSQLTGQIINIFYMVYNLLGGYGFLEKVYENALALRLQQAGFMVRQQYPIKVYLDGVAIGEYFADLVVNDLVIIELKSVQALIEEHEIQLLNYLKATKYEVGLLLNFGPNPEVRRKVYDNSRKPLLRK